MSRRYPTAELYEERERDFYRRGPRSVRGYDEEVDIELNAPPTAEYRPRPPPEFLREDYGRSASAGPLVLREQVEEPRRRPRREVDREEIIIRNGPGSEHGTERPRERTREIDIDFDDTKSHKSHKSRVPDDDARTIRTARSEHFARSERPRERERDEIDITINNREPERPRRREPDREETDVMIERSTSRAASRPPPKREPEREEIVFRRGEVERHPRPPRERPEREEIIFRRGEVERPPPPPKSVREEREEVIIRRDESDSRSRGRSPGRETIRIRERSEPPPRSEKSVGPQSRLVAREKEEVVFRRRERPPPPPSPPPPQREEIIIRRRERSPSPPPPAPPPPPPVERERIIFRRRDSSPPAPPPPPPVERERIVIRRRGSSPSPPPPPPPAQEQIIIRRREPSPSPSPSPPPPPQMPEPIFRPPIREVIEREIITHHRHIDHGVERAYEKIVEKPRTPTPPPPPPSPPKEDNLEIEIRRRGNGRDEDIFIEHNHDAKKKEEPKPEMALERIRSTSAAPARRRTYHDDFDIEAEADYYNRKALERGYPGEAWNGATKDWGLVDVPPGTAKVRMDGAGGGAQEISWKRYDGNRRSKFITGDEEFDTEWAVPSRALTLPPPPPPKPKAPDMWTEITKDLVIKEAIEEMGYSYEETEEFFYVMEYLKYEDVLQLVELTEDIRKDRRTRIRQIEYEREDLHRARPRHDERVYEREVVYRGR